MSDEWMPDDVIRPEGLEVGKVYRLRARNLSEGVWNGETFVGWRVKWGEVFLDQCEVPYRTAWPLEVVGEVEARPLAPYVGSRCRGCGGDVEFQEWGEDRPEDARPGSRGRWYHLAPDAWRLPCEEVRPQAKRNEPLYAELRPWLPESSEAL